MCSCARQPARPCRVGAGGRRRGLRCRCGARLNPAGFRRALSQRYRVRSAQSARCYWRVSRATSPAGRGGGRWLHGASHKRPRSNPAGVPRRHEECPSSLPSPRLYEPMLTWWGCSTGWPSWLWGVLSTCVGGSARTRGRRDFARVARHWRQRPTAGAARPLHPHGQHARPARASPWPSPNMPLCTLALTPTPVSPRAVPYPRLRAAP